MISRISELQPNEVETIRGLTSQVEDDSFVLTNSSGTIEVSLDELDDNDLRGCLKSHA